MNSFMFWIRLGLDAARLVYDMFRDRRRQFREEREDRKEIERQKVGDRHPGR